jgi:site-specific recombinase XerD
MLVAETFTETSLTAAFAEYRSVYLAGRDLAKRTRAEYGRDVADLVSFLKGPCGLSSPSQVDKLHLDLYLAELDRRALAGETQRRRVAVIRSFCSFLLERRYVAVSPSAQLAPISAELKEPLFLSRSDYQRLQGALAQSLRDHVERDAALIELFLQAGIRLSEAAALTRFDVQLPQRLGTDFADRGRLYVRGKGCRERLVALNPQACQVVRAYLAVRPTVSDSRLFITRFGRGMQPRAIERAVDKYFREAGIVGASVHTLRHTFATHLVAQGASLELVRQILGLNRIRQVDLYVRLAAAEHTDVVQADALLQGAGDEREPDPVPAHERI